MDPFFGLRPELDRRGAVGIGPPVLTPQPAPPCLGVNTVNTVNEGAGVMALMKCKECGKEIAKSAKACPSCGAVVKRTGCLTMGLAIFTGFVVLSAIITALRDYPAPASSTAQAPAARPAPSEGHATASGNPAHDKLVVMSNADRNAFFTKYLKGEKCGTVTRNFLAGVSPSGSTKGQAWWNVQCSDGSAYAIQIMPDAKGATSIMDCGVMKAVGAGECFKKMK